MFNEIVLGYNEVVHRVVYTIGFGNRVYVVSFFQEGKKLGQGTEALGGDGAVIQHRLVFLRLFKKF